MTKKRSEPEPERPSWRTLVESALQQAFDHPEEFVEDAKLLAKKVQATVREASDKLQNDPGMAGRVARNNAIKSAAKWARKKLDEIE